MSEVKSNIRAMADSLAADYELDSAKGRIKFNDAEKKLSEHLPEGVTMDVVKEVQGFLIDAAASAALASGEITCKDLTAKDSVPAVNSTVKFGHSEINTNFRKVKSGTTNGHDWTKYGSVTSNVVIGVGRASRPFKDVEEHLAAKAESVFSN